MFPEKCLWAVIPSQSEDLLGLDFQAQYHSLSLPSRLIALQVFPSERDNSPSVSCHTCVALGSKRRAQLYPLHIPFLSLRTQTIHVLTPPELHFLTNHSSPSVVQTNRHASPNVSQLSLGALDITPSWYLDGRT